MDPMSHECRWRDRLIDFVRDDNHRLLSEFDAVRCAVICGDDPHARALLAEWRGHLLHHLDWEEGPVSRAYERRCRLCDIEGLHAHTRDHAAILTMVDELIERLDSDPLVRWNSDIRDLLDTIDAALTDHRLVEENEICFTLDHTLDAPTIRRIEAALVES
jgi:hypothetical protein